MQDLEEMDDLSSLDTEPTANDRRGRARSGERSGRRGGRNERMERPQRSGGNRRPSRTETVSDNDDEEDDIDAERPRGPRRPPRKGKPGDGGKGTSDKKILVIVGVVCVVLLVLVSITMKKFSKQEDEPVYQPPIVSTAPKEEEDTYAAFKEQHPDGIMDEKGNVISYDGVYDLNGNVINKDAIVPGEKDYSKSNQNQTSAQVFDANDFIADLNGVNVPAVYNVKSRDYVEDYVSYTANRGIVDDGMELYWLDVEYHKKKYRVQIPFYYFKDMQSEGICKVQIELLTLEGGGKIISYMNVLPFDD